MIVSLSILLTVGAAHASDEDVSATQQTAVPAAAAPAQADKVAPPPPPPAPPSPEITRQKLRALRTYKGTRLSIHTETEFRGGSAYMMGAGYGGYWGGPGWGSWGFGGPVVVDPPSALRTWGIYRGPERLDMDTFLGLVGEKDKQTELRTDLDRLLKRQRRWNVLAGAGGAGVVAGLVGMSALVNTPEEYAMYNTVTLAGTLVLATGLVGSSFPRGKSSALLRYPSTTMGGADAQRLVEQHNEQLRDELGLTAADVWALEEE